MAARRGERRQPTWADPDRRLPAPGIKARSWGVPHALSLVSTSSTHSPRLRMPTHCESRRGRRLERVARQLRRAERRRVTAAHRSRLVLALALASWQCRQGQRLLGSRNRGRGQGPHPPTRPDCSEGGHRRILEIKSASADTQILPRVPQPRRCARYRRCSRTAPAPRQQARQG